MGSLIQEEVESMKCVICKSGDTQPGLATVTLERAGTTLVFKNVPAEICDVCGEQYIAEETSATLLRQTNEAANSGVQVEIRSYLAA